MSATAAMWPLSRGCPAVGAVVDWQRRHGVEEGRRFAVIGAGGIWFAEVRRDRAAGK
jgi:hypothetical protein